MIGSKLSRFLVVLALFLPGISYADGIFVQFTTYDAGSNIYNLAHQYGETFTVPNDGFSYVVPRLDFYLWQTGNATAVAKIYSSTGSCGSTATPNTLLATSNTVNLNTVPATDLADGTNWISFTFSTPLALTNNVCYIGVIDYSGTNQVKVALDTVGAGGNYSGNAVLNDPFVASATLDYNFRVWTSSTTGSMGVATTSLRVYDPDLVFGVGLLIFFASMTFIGLVYNKFKV